MNISANLKHFVTVACIGALVGIATLALGFMLEKYVVSPIGCQADSSIIRCENAEAISHNLALLIGAAIGLLFLIRRAVFRPLLVVLAAVVSLWGIGFMLTSFSWIAATLLAAALFALIYSMFAWLASTQRFWVALVTIVVTVIVLRIALNL